MPKAEPLASADQKLEIENRKARRIVQYVLLGTFCLWALIVFVRFFQEHPFELKYLWRLILNFRIPVPGSMTKAAAAVKHLALAGLFVFTGVLAGNRLLRMTGLRQPGCSEGKWPTAQYLLLALGLGWGLVMYVVFFLGAAGALYPEAIWIFMLLVLIVCFRDVNGLSGNLRLIFSREGTENSSPALQGGLALFWLVILSLLIIALAPSITHDAMVYHLNVPRVYATSHKITAIPYNLFSNTVLNQEMLYTAALLVDDFMLANLMHLIMGAGALSFLYTFARGSFGGTVAALATMIFFFNPLVLNETPMAYADMGMAFYFLLAAGCMWRWQEQKQERWFFLLCIFAGIFAGMKYTSIHGLLAMCASIGAVEILGGRRIGGAVKHSAIFAGVVAIFVLPYLIKNYIITGNPLYPLMYDIFGGRWLTPRQVERMLAYVNSHGMGHDPGSLAALPWNITILGKSGFANFDAVITPLWLILLPAFLFIRPKPAILKWALFVSAAYFVSWAASTHITRYLTPVFPLLSLICAYTAVSIKERAELLSRPLAGALKAGAVVALGLVWLSFASEYPLRAPSEFGSVVWGKQTRDEFLKKKVPGYSAFKYINENLPENARLIFFWDNRGFFCDRSQIGDSVFEAPSMLEMLHEAGSARAFHDKLRSMGITHILYNEFFLSKFPPYEISVEDAARLEEDREMLQEFLKGYCLPFYFADGTTLYAVHV